MLLHRHAALAFKFVGFGAIVAAAAAAGAGSVVAEATG